MKDGAKRRGLARELLQGRYFPYLILAPAMIVIFFLALFPLFYALWMSLHDLILTNPGSPPFCGLNNFRKVLHDPAFWWSVRNTFVFTFSAVGIEMVLGTAVAFLLNRRLRLQGVIRALLLLPVAAAPIAVGLTWRYMYHTDFGVFNHIVSLLGLSEHNWLGDTATAMPSVILFDVWQWTPFVALIVLAGLQSLPKEPFEAAEVDGASSWQVFRIITLPMLAPLLLFVFLLRVIDAIRIYDPIFALTRGGPGSATETMSWYLYRIGFKFFDMGQASAQAFIFLYFQMILAAITIRFMQKFMIERG